MHTPFPYLANGWADCVKVLCVARDPLDKRFIQVRDVMHLHVRTCRHFYISRKRLGGLCLNLMCGYWLGTHSVSLFQMWGQSARARAHVHTLPHNGAFAVARSTPIKAPYWLYMTYAPLAPMFERCVYLMKVTTNLEPVGTDHWSSSVYL